MTDAERQRLARFAKAFDLSFAVDETGAVDAVEWLVPGVDPTRVGLWRIYHVIEKKDRR